MLKAPATHSMWAIPPKVVSVSSRYILHAWRSYPVKIFSWPPRTATDFEYLNLASYVNLQTSRDIPRSRSSQRPWHGIARDFGVLTRDRVLVEVFFCHFLPIWKCNAESTGRHTVQTGQTFKTYVHLYRFCQWYSITCSTLSSLLDHKNESEHKAGSEFGKDYWLGASEGWNCVPWRVGNTFTIIFFTDTVTYLRYFRQSYLISKRTAEGFLPAVACLKSWKDSSLHLLVRSLRYLEFGTVFSWRFDTVIAE